METSLATTFQFFERVQRYLRSIGYYGDSPMLTAVYGSSEYAQALSRTGSIFGNIFIVNNEVNITEVNITLDKGFESVKFHFNTTPVLASKGLIIGPDYHDFMLKKLGIEVQAEVKKCVRATLITRGAYLGLEHEKVATFVYPPFTFGET